MLLLTRVGLPQEVIEPSDPSAFDPMIAESIQKRLAEVRQAPGDFEKQLALGRVYSANGALNLADRVFTICIELDPKSETAYYSRARTRYDQSRIPEAIADLHTAATLDESHTALHWRLGFWLIEDGQVERAEQRFARALEQEPGNLPAEVGMAMVAIMNREYESASSRLESLLSRGETNPYIHHLLAMAYRGQRKFNEALRAAAVASGKRPSFPDPWDDAIASEKTGYKPLLSRALAYMNRQQFEQAFVILDSLRQVHSDDPVVLNYYFYVYSRMGRHDRARDILLEGLELDPDHIPTHINLSLAYERLGDPGNAIRYADRAVELGPRYGPALLQRGRLALLQNDVEAGAGYLKRATECGIHDPEQRIMYGRVLASQQEWRASASVFQQVIQNSPDQPHAWAGLAVCLAALGDVGTAQTAIARAQQLAPGDAFVDEAVQRVRNAQSR